MRRTGQDRSDRAVRNGFTLLEVLMALGLTMLLIAAVYKAIDLHWSYQTAGRDQIERSQVARALLHRMSSDLKSIVFVVPPEKSNSEDEAATDADATSQTTTTDVTDPLEGSTMGLKGTSDRLQILVSRPTRLVTTTKTSQVDGEVTIASQQKTVSYFLADAGSGGLTGAVGNLAAGGSAGASFVTGIQGLARLEADRVAVEFADSQRDLDQLAAQAKLLAPAVVSLQFRYFDGVEWVEAWDSNAYVEQSVDGSIEEVIAGLPQAVEITLGLRNEQDTEEGIADQTYRLVVSLPTAQKNVEGIGL
ncbi:MAG: prepilin-type N-terminal cleavage/methylation domain-containing protein [Planctomycetota bacterium]|nr:prepilin-type N-terminal cleavage/methylation domain-containing protein [Planctomycetota bacterium]